MLRSLHLIFVGVAAIFAVLLMPSCISDDITTDPSARLSFSRDTVSFDTVFTDLGTPTARLQVFNRNNKGVSISRIQFRNPDGPFSINVDGVSGKSFSDVEIRANDSIYIFLECYLPETASKTPQLTEDLLTFQINGREQSVLVEAWGRNVTRLRSLTVEGETTLTAEQPYVIFDTLRVARTGVLKVLPGAQLLFHDKAALVVEGRLEAVGTADKKIDMRGDRLDNVLPDVGYDILAGQWHGVTIRPGSFDNRMEYVDMRSTTSGLAVDSTAVSDRPRLTLVNSWLHNSQASALKSSFAKVDAYGCVFSESADATVLLEGGEHHFVNCTISNYYLFAAPSEPLLTLRHCLPDDLNRPDYSALPLMKADFENCIIYGLAPDIDPGDLTGSAVYLRNTLLKSEGKNDANFIDCLWGEDPLFMTIREDYIFDYRVKAESPAIGAGFAAFVQPFFANDILGAPRALPDGRVTLGAYATPVEPEE